MSTERSGRPAFATGSALATALIVASACLGAGADSSRDVQSTYARAAEEVAAGSYAAARADTRALLRLQPDDPRATAILIDADFLDGRTAEARRLYARCSACIPEPPVDAITREAIVRGHIAPFFRMLRPQLSQLYPDGPQPFDAIREAAQGRYGAALRLLAPMVKEQPTRPDLRLYRALVFRGLGRRADARRDLGVAVLFRPTLPDAGVPVPLDRLQQVSLWALSVLSPA